jgi:hypothetical protein
MPENDRALEKAREILRTWFSRGGVQFTASAESWIENAIAAELRKERERAEDTESDLSIWRDAAQKQQRLREAADAKAAALEAALHLVKPLKQHSGYFERPHTITSIRGCEYGQLHALVDATDAALRDHGGALAEHDAEVRRAALLEAEALFPDSPRSGQDWTPRQVRMRLRRFAEEGATK